MVLRPYFNDKGKCNSCGFLSKRHFSDPPECLEATLHNRSFGDLYSHPEYTPWCFIQAAKLLSEVEKVINDTQEPDNVCVKQVIDKDRQCPRWLLWKEFLSPKEHFEEYKMLELEQRQKEFEQRMEKERKEFDLKLFEIDQNSTKKMDSFNRRMTWFFVMLALLSLIGTLLPLAWPNGIPQLMNLVGSK